MTDIVIIVIVACAAIWGFNTGLVRTVFNLGRHVASFIAAMIFYPMVTQYLKGTALYSVILNRVTASAADSGVVKVDALPVFLQPVAEAGVNSAVGTVAASVTELFIMIIAIVIVFVAVKLALGIVSAVINKASKLPVISSMNKLGGFALGIVNGLIVVYLLMAVLTLFPESPVLNAVMQGSVSKMMYENNLIMKLIFKA